MELTAPAALLFALVPAEDPSLLAAFAFLTASRDFDSRRAGV